MPRRDLGRHFEETKPEWTERKHLMLRRILVPTAQKMKNIRGRLALVDGYAGPNEYGGKVQGSTTILVDVASGIAAKGFEVRVFACEPAKDRHEQLVQNLREHVDSGLLTTYCGSHAASLPLILKAVEGWPAFVFLDPHGPRDLQLDTDIKPWIQRAKTDVLGVFMANAAARACAEAMSEHASDGSRQTAEAILGPRWREGTTEVDASRIFLAEVGGKQFTGLYPLRKLETQHRAYAMFGASDSEHGFHLLSDAVARDSGALEDFDFKKRGLTLFSEIDKDDEQQAEFDNLIELVRPLIAANPNLTGQDLALALYRKTTNIQSVFGRFKESDFTKASRVCREGRLDG